MRSRASDPSMRHFEALEKEAARLGLPQSFQTDLTNHDRRALSEHPPSKPFIWCLYDAGTHLVFPEGDIDTKAAKIIRRCAAVFPGGHWYHWCYNCLYPTTVDELARLLEEGVED